MTLHQMDKLGKHVICSKCGGKITEFRMPRMNCLEIHTNFYHLHFYHTNGENPACVPFHMDYKHGARGTLQHRMKPELSIDQRSRYGVWHAARNIQGWYIDDTYRLRAPRDNRWNINIYGQE